MNRTRAKAISAEQKIYVPAVRVHASVDLMVKLSRNDKDLTKDELVNVGEYLVADAYKKVVVSSLKMAIKKHKINFFNSIQMVMSIVELVAVMKNFKKNFLIILKHRKSSWIAICVTKLQGSTAAYIMDSFGDAPIVELKKALGESVKTSINTKRTVKTNDSGFVALKNLEILANENYQDFGLIPAVTAEDIEALKKVLEIEPETTTLTENDLDRYANTIVADADKKFDVSFRFF
jgi:hypothetical protein